MIEPDSPTLEEFTSLMAARHAYIVQDYNARRSVLDSKRIEIYAKLDDLEFRLHQAGLCFADVYETMEFKNWQIEVLEYKSDRERLHTDWLLYKEETRDIIEPLQDSFTAAIEAKLGRYQKGNQHKSSASAEKWELANKLFKEEIPRHNTLKAARLAAAEKAGVFAEERQLRRMMPVPR